MPPYFKTQADMKCSQHFTYIQSRDGQCILKFSSNQNPTQKESKVIRLFHSQGIRLRKMAGVRVPKIPKFDLAYPKTYTRTQKV